MSGDVFRDLESALDLQPGDGKAVAAAGLAIMAFGLIGQDVVKPIQAADSLDRLLDMAMRAVGNYILVAIERGKVTELALLILFAGLHLAESAKRKAPAVARA
jgi:hypothetical protein